MLRNTLSTSCRGLLRKGFSSPSAAFRILLTFAVFALLAVPLRAQLYSGSVTGIVSDPTGAVIPGAKVTLTDTTKGYAFTATTDSVGRYILRNLPPSTYTLSVGATGFKSSTRSDIVLDVGQNANVNVSLELGTTTQTVEVSGAPPLLATQDATTGQEVNRTYINDLPLVGRGVFDLAFLSPGVNPAPTTVYGSGGVANNFTSNGGRNATSDILIDGVSTTDYEQNGSIIVPLYTPSVDAVQEFKVQQNNFSAEIGFSGNTVLNVVMRSGTNNLHGSLYEFLRNQALDANDWFNNLSGVDLPARRYNQFGGTVGGPIVIPNLYNGKDKTFFFFDYQATRDHSAQSFRAGVPSAAERNGDFGELCARSTDDAGNPGTFNSSGQCSASDGQLWDPYSGINDENNGGWVNTAIIPYNNMATYMDTYTATPASPLYGTPYQLPAVPGNIIDPVSQKMMSYYPLPNVGVGTDSYDPYNNWHGAGVNINNGDQYDIKIDHRFSNSNLLSARYSQQWGNGHGGNCWKNALDPCTGGPVINSAHAFVLNDTWTLNPSTVVNFGYGITRSYSYGQGPGPDFPNFDPVTDLGLPSYITQSGFPTAPTVYVYGGYQQAGCCGSLGYQAWAIIKYGQETHDLLGSLDKIAGRHELKVGGEFRMHRITFGQPGAPAGLEIFDVDGTQQYVGNYEGGGDAMATFLTGVGTSNQWGEYEVPLFIATQSLQYGAFLQDSWRVTDKLTLNLGVRYDLDLPRTERHDRQEWFDPSAALPFTVPGMNVTGTEQFAGVNGNPRTLVDSYYKEFAPRIGLAYRFWNNTVFRAGYGIYYNPSQYAAAGTGAGAGDGFTGVTNWPQTYNNNGFTPFYTMANPFPNGINQPTGSSLGPYTQLGQGTSSPVRNYNAPPYVQTWSAGIQHELPAGLLLDVNYLGTKGTHLYFGGAGDINHLGSWVESLDATQASNLENTYVPNPFYGLITDPTSSISGDEVPQVQLERPYPQFTGVNILNPPRGNSIYHAFQLRVQKNMSHGLQFVGNYTWAKTISDSDVYDATSWLGGFAGVQDPNNLKLERSVSEYSIPQVLTFGYVYELPFGRGKQFGSKWNPVVNAVLGGWKTTGLWRFDDGQPVAINLSGGTNFPTYGSQRPNLTGRLERNTGSDWRTQYFANPEVVQVPPIYTLGTAQRTLPNVRMPGASTAGLSLMKQFPMGAIHEGMMMEFRLESFNAFNHPQFGCLNGTVQTDYVGSDSGTFSGFGQLNCQANSPRELQLGLKLYF